MRCAIGMLALSLGLGACDGAGEGAGGLDVHVKDDDCAAACGIARFDVRVTKVEGQARCLFAWRTAEHDAQLVLSGLIADGVQGEVQVVALCADGCAACAGTSSFAEGARGRVELALAPVAGCAVAPLAERFCDACDAQSTGALCEGNARATCAGGAPRRETCAGLCRDGRCEPPAPCTESRFYRDADGDGFGDAAVSISACTAPPSSAQRAGDCDDGDKDAHPGQTRFFARPTATSGRFDFDCDGRDEPELPVEEGNCDYDAASGTCQGGGWYGRVPACGASGMQQTCIALSAGRCTESVKTDVQRCR